MGARRIAFQLRNQFSGLCLPANEQRAASHHCRLRRRVGGQKGRALEKAIFACLFSAPKARQGRKLKVGLRGVQ